MKVKKLKIQLILANFELNKLLNNREITELSIREKIVAEAYLTVMKNLYIELN